METTRTFQTTAAAEDRRGRRLLGATALLLIAAGGLFACADGSSDSARTDKARTARLVPAAAVEVDPAPDTTVVDPAPVAPVAPVAPNAPGGNAPAPPPAPKGPAPVIHSFLTPEDIDCHNASLQSFTATWSTDGVKVTISIDGPGVYAEYGPNGDTSLPFSCSSSHSFKLTAHGADGQTTSKTVTLEPRNVQPPQDEDDEL